MSPKATATGDSLDAASVKFILSTLKACSEFAPDWSQVAREHDIKYAKNARPRFNTIVARFGFKLEDKKIVQIDQGRSEEDDATIRTPIKKGKHPKRKDQASNKKRKVEYEDDEDEIGQVMPKLEDGIETNGIGCAETAGHETRSTYILRYPGASNKSADPPQSAKSLNVTSVTREEQPM